MKPFKPSGVFAFWIAEAEGKGINTERKYHEMDMIDFARYVWYDKKGNSFTQCLEDWKKLKSKP
jgi:hypothetical protein